MAKLLQSAVGSSLAVVLLATSPASAQLALDEIVVTAQKREQSMQDVPISISTVSEQALRNNLVTDIYDLQSAVPALQVQAVDPPGQGTAFALRGLGNSVFNMGFDPAVATFVDGVYRSRSGLVAASDFLDLERVEVLKGPQGTLFGKNTTAGVVHMISKKPNFEGNSGYIELGIEDYGRTRLKGSVNLAASATAAFRIGATFARGDGWLDLINSGQEIHDLDRFAVKAQALFAPSEDVTLHIIADYAKLGEVCCAPLRNANDPFTAGVNGAAAVAAGSGIVDPPDLDNLVSESNQPPAFDAEDVGISAELNWQISDAVSLTSITAYRNYEDTNVKDNDFSGVDVLRSNQSLPEVSLLSQELRFAGEGELSNGKSFNWMVGGYFSREEIQVINEFIWGPQISLFPFFAPGLFGNVPGRAFWHQFDQEIDSSALFAHTNWDISDTVTFTLGARYSKDEKKGSLISDHPFTNLFGAPNALPLSVVYDYDTTHDDSEPTYTATLDWRATDDVLLFGTYSRGYKSGGISMTRDAAGAALSLGDPVLGCPPGFTAVPASPFCSGPMFSPTFEREEADHIEIGMKADLLDDRLRLNASIWNTEFNNLQTQTLRSDGAFAVVNIAGATSQGLEIESTFRATEAITLNASVQFLDATYEDGLPALTPGFPPIGGERIPFSSETTANLGISFEQPVASGDWTAYGSANAYYRSKYFNFTEPNPALVQSGYTLLGLRVGMRNDNWDFSAWCRNCGDERVSWSNFQIPFDGLLIAPPGSSIGTRWSHIAEPRIWGVNAAYRFQ